MGERDLRAGEDCTREARSTARQLHVRAGERDDERLAGERRRRPRREPVRVYDICRAGRPSGRADEGRGETRYCPGPFAHVVDDAATVGEPEVAVDAWGHDVDLEPSRP